MRPYSSVELHCREAEVVRRVKNSAPSRPDRSKAIQDDAVELRRGRLLVGASVLVAVILLVAWFPAAALLHQRSAIAAAAAQVSTLRQDDARLAQESGHLIAPESVTQLARSQYQLVEPGQRLVQVLPASAKPTSAASGQAPYPGDPGSAKIMAPSAVALLPGESTPSVKTNAGTPGETLIHRILSTLEFWKR